MRLLFSSPHPRLVEEMGKKLSDSGVACEVRYRPERPGASQFSGYRELWIRMDQELQWAIALLALHSEVARN
jgi:hypothetical protein